MGDTLRNGLQEGRHRAVVAHEPEERGELKVGPASFGWLTASGVAILLIALAAAGGVATEGVTALIALGLVVLAGALLGGLASMGFHRTVGKTGVRFHRTVDKTGLGT